MACRQNIDRFQNPACPPHHSALIVLTIKHYDARQTSKDEDDDDNGDGDGNEKRE